MIDADGRLVGVLRDRPRVERVPAEPSGPMRGARLSVAAVDEAPDLFVDVPGITGLQPTEPDDADELWSRTMWANAPTPEVYRTILGMRPCPRCQGACITVEDARAARATGWRTRVPACPFCGGRGLVHP